MPRRHRAGGSQQAQLIAAAAAVVWLAGFVQAIVDEVFDSHWF
jgi:hypothetical protein